MVWLCRLAGQDVSLIPGSELVEPVAGTAARLDVPVAIDRIDRGLARGGRRGARVVRCPGLQVVARIAPEMGFDPEGATAAAAIETLAASGAAGVLLGPRGAQAGDLRRPRAAGAARRRFFLSIGAGLDFLSGHQTRAPRWVRRLAMEWLWRMAGNPGSADAPLRGTCFVISARGRADGPAGPLPGKGGAMIGANHDDQPGGCGHGG